MAERLPDREVLERVGILGIHAMLRQLRLGWGSHLEIMDYTRLPKQLFYRDVAMGARRPGEQKQRYKDTFKKSLRRLQVNSDWKNSAQNRPTWVIEGKIGAVVYEANRAANAKTKRTVGKSQTPPIRNISTQCDPTCPRGQRTFRAQIGLFGHRRTQCTNHPTTATAVSTTAPAPA